MYQTEFLKPSLLNLEDFDEIVFTSRSTVDAFFALYDHLPQTILCVVLGPFTKQALLERGVEEAYISS
jgi:uroporphyrinogen-III synthase